MVDPRKRFVWAFRGIGFNGTPFLAPEAVFEDWSEHLSAAGFIHVSEVEDHVDLEALGIQGQTIKYQPPVRGQDHPLNGSGEWVPVDQEIVEPLVPSVHELTPSEQAVMIAEFREAGLI